MVKKIQERPSDPAVPQDEFMRGMAEGMWIAMTLVSAMMGHIGDARSNRTVREVLVMLEESFSK